MDSRKYSTINEIIRLLQDHGNLMRAANTEAEINAAFAKLDAFDIDRANATFKATFEILGEVVGGRQASKYAEPQKVSELYAVLDSLGPLEAFSDQLGELWSLRDADRAVASKKWTKLKSSDFLKNIETFRNLVSLVEEIGKPRLMQ
jgi:hypothetical protein